jgi:CheY-like chemotaxis protein
VISREEGALLGVRVLVVDDSEINLDMTRRVLEIQGAQVFLANNGREAFAFLEADGRAVDVVLMDIQMPVLDGHDATRRIRLELSLADLPIIALTAGALSSVRQQASAAGMNDYIIKPFDPQALVSRILRHVKPTRVQGPPPAGAAFKTQAPTATSQWCDIEGIDSSDACKRVGGDFGLFRSMLARFLQEFADVAIPPGGGEVGLEFHRARMHKLRGSAGMLGAKTIQNLAGETEAACAIGERERAADLAKQLAAYLERMQHNAAASQGLLGSMSAVRMPGSSGPGNVEAVSAATA